MFMIITFMVGEAFSLDDAKNWDNFWPISNLSVTICSWIAVDLWRNKHGKPHIPKIVERVAFYLVLGVGATLVLILTAIDNVVPDDRQQSRSWPEYVLQGDAYLSYPT